MKSASADRRPDVVEADDGAGVLCPDDRTRHAPDRAALLVLGDHGRAGAAQGTCALGAVGAHSGEHEAQGRRSEVPGGVVEQHVDRRTAEAYGRAIVDAGGDVAEPPVDAEMPAAGRDVDRAPDQSLAVEGLARGNADIARDLLGKGGGEHRWHVLDDDRRQVVERVADVEQHPGHGPGSAGRRPDHEIARNDRDQLAQAGIAAGDEIELDVDRQGAVLRPRLRDIAQLEQELAAEFERESQPAATVGLGDDIHRALGHAFERDAGVSLVERRRQQHARMRALAQDLGQGSGAVDAGHVEVENHYVRLEAARMRNGRLAVAGDRHQVKLAAFPKPAGKQAPHHHGVIGDDHRLVPRGARRADGGQSVHASATRPEHMASTGRGI
ncbi:MAG: hypothetical protein K2X84_02630, partial [Beijerinckiaceae bacterium]|nr:hypothetical protein [Beijerinckiaceae bacterium]